MRSLIMLILGTGLVLGATLTLALSEGNDAVRVNGPGTAFLFAFLGMFVIAAESLSNNEPPLTKRYDITNMLTK